MKKVTATVLACILLLCCVVGGSLAWLTDKTEPVNNVFTTSNINITLAETTGNEYKMIPGWEIDKDPLVTVKAGSEDCWVFIKVEKEGGNVTVNGTTYSFDDYITYAIDGNWTQLDGNVYYCKVTDVEADRNIKVLGYYDETGQFVNNKVLVKYTVTKEMMDALETTSAANPTLKFTAYAAQMYKNNTETFTPAEAWKIISGNYNT